MTRKYLLESAVPSQRNSTHSNGLDTRYSHSTCKTLLYWPVGIGVGISTVGYIFKLLLLHADLRSSIAVSSMLVDRWRA
jgi:hypothetical protein